MKIGLITSHSWPVNLFATHARTGDYLIALLAKTLHEQGHIVSMFSPDGGYAPSNHYTMQCSYGKYPPSAEECEYNCLVKWQKELLNQDIIHDFSTTKLIAEKLSNKMPVISTSFGGAINHPNPPKNIVVQTFAHQERAMRGATDYENTPTPNLAGPNGPNILSSRVVNNGIDTDFYCPGSEKSDHYLWMGRWHPVRGYDLAIEIAKQSKINLLIAGLHPDDEIFPSQKESALSAIEAARGHGNIQFQFLPNDENHHIVKRKLLQTALAFLYTVQFHEPFGLMQVESLACGTPVLSTNYGSMPEILSNFRTGILVENNVSSFINELQNIIKLNPEHCREEAVRRYDRKVMTKNYLELYNYILQGGNW